MFGSTLPPSLGGFSLSATALLSVMACIQRLLTLHFMVAAGGGAKSSSLDAEKDLHCAIGGGCDDSDDGDEDGDDDVKWQCEEDQAWVYSVAEWYYASEYSSFAHDIHDRHTSNACSTNPFLDAVLYKANHLLTNMFAWSAMLCFWR